jgi:predicted GIY-YIG superfamily endonuclease
MSATGGRGTIYTLHFDRPYKHAAHYTGWAKDLRARLAEHAAGRGARLLAVVKAAGIGWRLAATQEGTRSEERRLKQHGAARRCPVCQAGKETQMTAPGLVPDAKTEASQERPAALRREFEQDLEPGA